MNRIVSSRRRRRCCRHGESPRCFLAARQRKEKYCACDMEKKRTSERCISRLQYALALWLPCFAPFHEPISITKRRTYEGTAINASLMRRKKNNASVSRFCRRHAKVYARKKYITRPRLRLEESSTLDDGANRRSFSTRRALVYARAATARGAPTMFPFNRSIFVSIIARN